MGERAGVETTDRRREGTKGWDRVCPGLLLPVLFDHRKPEGREAG